MDNSECIAFLQWATPRLHMRWQGFRRVRKRVCRRIQQRINALLLEDSQGYRDYLQHHPLEWSQLDELCRVVVSRFYRDRRVFDFIYQQLLPQLARDVAASGQKLLRAWSIGCASGEEAYSLLLCWHHLPETERHGLALRLLASDTDPHLLQRAQQACYPYSSIKALPPAWREEDFSRQEEAYCLRPRFKEHMEFLRHDVREAFGRQHFHLVLCRNLVFTYYETSLQLLQLEKIGQVLEPGGILLIGARETLPPGQTLFRAHPACRGLYIREGSV